MNRILDKKCLIVGAGLTGATIARLIAEYDFKVDIIDQRDHLAGNCYDFLDENGFLVHKYGPHLFHTSNQQVIDFLSKFTEWVDYKHKVKALLEDGRFVTLPVNRETVSVVGEKNIIKTFFKPYTKKMWGLNIEEINPEILKRVPIRDDYNEFYYPLPFSFPLRTNFTVTSIVFEHRDVDLGNISVEQQASTNFHSGWDLAIPIGTNFYSICDGTVSNITNTQPNDLPYKESGNSTGNYMTVTCNNGFTAMYWHIQYKSQPYGIRKGTIVKKGELLGRTSTTGISTGPHLHLGLKDKEGNLLDAMSYIDFTEYEGN